MFCKPNRFTILDENLASPFLFEVYSSKFSEITDVIRNSEFTGTP